MSSKSTIVNWERIDQIMKFGKAVAKHRVLILILSLVLMIPALLGMMATRINYDMLDYLPQDIDTAVGQN